MPDLKPIKDQLKRYRTEDIENGFTLEHKSKKLDKLAFSLDLEKLIFPLREGEFIKDIKRLGRGQEYSLSYPGTASTKTMVLFSPKGGGLFIGGGPSFEFAKIKIKRLRGRHSEISYNSPEHKLWFIRFKKNWRTAADQYKHILGLEDDKKIKRKVKYFLQIGILDSFGNAGIRDFKDLGPVVDKFHQALGPGHIVHFFGTNQAGFDRMAPDYTIAPQFGGKKSFVELIKYIRAKGLMASHHYNPRIADSDWMRANPGFEKGVVMLEGNRPVVEKYKDHEHYFMNPNFEPWFERSMETVKYLRSTGLDYIQIDQFTYQRNFYHPEKPLQLGYRRMLDEFDRLGIKHWLEGVSDIQKLKPGNFYQILTRNIPQCWEDNESRRGYPYGVSYPNFFMYLYPNYEVSYQIVAEKGRTNDFEKRLKIARKINAGVYDLQMTFYSQKYEVLLYKLLNKIKKYGAEKG